jgi:tRNA (guanine6-N2)-methyltransferase
MPTDGGPQPAAARADSERVTFMARTIRGLEWVSAAEIQAVLGSRPITIEHRAVHFEHVGLPPELLTLGTVDDVFAVVCESGGVGRKRESLNALRRQMDRCDPVAFVPALRRLRAVPAHPSFDVTATFLGPRNFNRFEIEDAVGTALSRAAGWQYETRSGGRRPPSTDLSLRVHLSGDRATVAIRVGAAPLHRRPYRQASRTASLRPSLARALALLAGLTPTSALLDPFCGAGTIPIEAALARPGLTCTGYDIDPAVVDLARSNARRAGVDVRFARAQAAALPSESGAVDRIVTNPPWGQAVRASGSLAGAWREMGRVLSPDGRVALLGPDKLLTEAAVSLALESALHASVSLLGQHVAIALLAHDGRLTAPEQLFEREIDEAFARYANIVPASAGS